MVVVLLLVGAVCLGVGLQGHRHPLAAPLDASHAHRSGRAPSGTSSTARAPTVPAPHVLAVARSTPISLSIPAIGLTVSLGVLGLNATGTVQVPTDVQQPGWYHLGPSPGQVGSAVILGHVDTYLGPAVFYRLRTLVPGDDVAVTLADGVVTDFDVASSAQYLKTQFPSEEVYGTHGDSQLQLVTCGGTFDAATGHYLSNVVVYTTLVSAT